MPLISHSPEFIAKKRAKIKAEEKRQNIEKLRETANETAFIQGLKEIHEIPLNPELIIEALDLEQNLLPQHTLEDYELLFKCTRFVKRNHEQFGKFLGIDKLDQGEILKMFYQVQATLIRQIEILKYCEQFGLLAATERYDKKLIAKRKRTRQIA